MEHADGRRQSPDVFNLGIDEVGKTYLAETAKWAKFLAVVGFVLLGLLVVAGIFMSILLERFASLSGTGVPAGIFSVVYIIVAVINFFPVYYLYKFATNARLGLRSNDGGIMTSAFGYLRNAFRFIGIITLIIVTLYGAIFLFAAIVGAFSRL